MSSKFIANNQMTPIVLIPGLLCDTTVWQPLLHVLGGNATVADLRSQDDLTQMAHDCLDRHSGVLHVAGHSMGARVAMEMARIAPERIERLALLDTGIHPLKVGERASREEAVNFALENGMEVLADHWLSGMVYEPNQANLELMTNLKEMVLRCDTDMHARQMKALTDRPDASQYLSHISCPVLLMVGRYDQWSPVSQHEDMLKLLPNAQLEIIENAGHFAPLEQAASVSNRLVEFLT